MDRGQSPALVSQRNWEMDYQQTHYPSSVAHVLGVLMFLANEIYVLVCAFWLVFSTRRGKW